MLRPFSQHDIHVNPLRLASLLLGCYKLPAPRALTSPAITLRKDEVLTASTIWPLLVIIKSMAGRIFRVAHPAAREIAGASSHIHGSQPTHSPAQPMPIPDQWPGSLAPGSFASSPSTSSPLYRLSCHYLLAVVRARSDWSAATLSLLQQHHRLSVLLVFGVFPGS